MHRARRVFDMHRAHGIVLFLHAFPFSHRLWDGQIERLPPGWRALAPDLPGFGATPPGPPDLDAWARDLIDRLDRDGGARPVLVGLSMGGYVALRMLAIAPDRFAGALLADTRATPDTAEGRARRTATALRVRAEGVGWMPDAQVPGLLGPTTRATRPGVEAAVRAMMAAADPEGVARAVEAMRDRPDSSFVAAGLRVPVAVACGAEDALSPPDEMRALAATIPEATFHLLPGAGHLSCLETPDAFAAVLADLLGRCGPPA
jgi:3-oxoadipate enol-lactonase